MKRRAKFPQVITLEAVLKSVRTNQRQRHNGEWMPARPLGAPTIGNRLKCAWLVFTGKADALTWPEGQ